MFKNKRSLTGMGLLLAMVFLPIQCEGGSVDRSALPGGGSGLHGARAGALHTVPSGARSVRPGGGGAVQRVRVESIPKLVETPVTSSSSSSGRGDTHGMIDPEFLLNRGTEQREVAVAE